MAPWQAEGRGSPKIQAPKPNNTPFVCHPTIGRSLVSIIIHHQKQYNEPLTIMKRITTILTARKTLCALSFAGFASLLTSCMVTPDGEPFFLGIPVHESYYDEAPSCVYEGVRYYYADGRYYHYEHGRMVYGRRPSGVPSFDDHPGHWHVTDRVNHPNPGSPVHPGMSRNPAGPVYPPKYPRSPRLPGNMAPPPGPRQAPPQKPNHSKNKY